MSYKTIHTRKYVQSSLNWFLRTGGYLIFVFAMSWTYAPAQISSVEINYFSRCRQLYDERDRLACYDGLYDQAVRAADPEADAARLREENRRMREELARIRGGSVTPADEPSGNYRRRESYPAAASTGTYRSRTPVQTDSRADNFGIRDSSASSGRTGGSSREDAPRLVTGDDGEEELIGRIAELQRGQNGWIVTLEHGQVWRQMNTKRYALREGQEVRIYPTRWGDSYRLSVVDGAGFIQVERIE